MELYALCDADTLALKGVSLEEFVTLAKEAKIIQYRNKNGDVEASKAALITLRQLYDGILIINDYIDLVPFCDGLHVGQEDLAKINSNKTEAITTIRDAIGQDKYLGISTHNVEEVEEANALDINYIGLGAYRNTSTKDISTLLGDRLDTIASHSKHPVAAIGGVRKSDTFNNVRYLVIGSDLYAH